MDQNLQGTVGEHLDTVSKYVDMLAEFGIEYGFQILGALVFLLIGLKVASWIGGRVTKMLEGRNVDITLARFIGFALDQTDRAILTTAAANLAGFALIIGCAYGAAWFKSQPWRARR